MKTAGERPGEILLLSGPPGAGKSTVARALTASCTVRAVHIHSDIFWDFIRTGRIAPWLPQSHAQNQVVIDALASSARAYAKGGYFVVLDGILGPWFLPRIREAVHVPLHYVVLRPALSIVLQRAREREDGALKDPAPIESLHRQFADLGALEPHVLDTTLQGVEDTVRELRGMLATGAARLLDAE